MAMGVSYITSIALVTLEVTHHPCIVDRELLGNIAARKHRLDSCLSFTLRSFNCIFMILADAWSLRGLTTRVMVSVVDLDRNEDMSATPKFRKALTEVLGILQLRENRLQSLALLSEIGP